MYKLVEQVDWGQERIIGYFSFQDHAVEAAYNYLKQNYEEYWPVDIDLKEFDIVMRWFGQGKSLTIYMPDLSYENVR